MISVFITATKPLFTPKNVEFWTEWVGGNDSLLATRLIAWGGGGNEEPRDESKADHWEQSPLQQLRSFDLHCLTLRISFHFGYQIVKLNSKHNSGWPQRNKKQN